VLVPLFSTSDIAFLLLIFIMLISLINYRRVVGIDYAEAATPRRVTAERNLELWVDRAGNYYLDGKPTSLSALEASLEEARPVGDENTRVHIIADRDTPFEEVHRVIEILQLLEHRLVSFVVRAVQ